jgi:hypothetical protein
MRFLGRGDMVVVAAGAAKLKASLSAALLIRLGLP